jgi:hypothetical protein
VVRPGDRQPARPRPDHGRDPRTRRVYLARPDQPIGPHLADRLRGVQARLDARIAGLQQPSQRLDDFEASHQAELGCHGGADFRASDPKFKSTFSMHSAATNAVNSGG